MYAQWGRGVLAFRKFGLPPTGSHSPRVRQRRNHMRAELSEANNMLAGLSCLSVSFASSSVSASATFPPAETRCRAAVLDAARSFVHASRLSAVCDGFAPTDPWGYCSDKPALPIIADRVALPSAAATCSLDDVLPADIYRTIDSLDKLALPTSSVKACRSRVPPTPRAELCKLYARMRAAGMLAFYDRVLDRRFAPLDLFCVEKDDGSLRLIVDGRPSNKRMVAPPKLSLPWPGLFASFAVPPGERLMHAKADADNFFHRMKLPAALVPAFPLRPVRADEVGMPGAGRTLYPYLLTLPMGWAHSPFIAQAVHEAVLLELGVTRDRMLCADTPLPVRLSAEPWFSVYLDDLSLFATTAGRGAAEAFFDRYEALMAAKGIPLKLVKTVRPTTAPLTSLGMTVHPERRRVAVSVSKAVALRQKVARLLRAGVCSGKQLSALLGQFGWVFSIRPPLRSVFQSAYRLAALCMSRPGKVFACWPSVRRELRTAASLLPLAFAQLSDFGAAAVCTDASSVGLGVVAGKLDATRLDLVPARAFAPLAAAATGAVSTPTVTYDGRAGSLPPALAAAVASSPPPGADCSSWWTSLRLPKKKSNSNATEPVIAGSTVHLLGRVLVPRAGLPVTWRRIVAARWRRRAHINELELRAMHTGLAWALSCGDVFERRLVMLTDSAVAAAAMLKGRCTSPTLLRRVRALAALQLAAGVQVWPAWIPTAVNPADGPSRGF